MEESIPHLRTDIELFPAYHQGKKGLIVKDSLNLIKEPIFLQGELLEVLSLIDGERNIRDVQVELVRKRGGVFVSFEEVEKLIQELDAVFLLESERYHQEKKRIASEYSLLEIREAFHAGRSYPADSEELSRYLDSFFRTEEEPFLELKEKRIRALISPHIDLEAGKEVYGRAYQAIKNSALERIILFGTGHNLNESFLSLTEKNFETPLGEVRTDKDFVGELRKAGDRAVSPSDIAHRSEHSLEFQLIFLQHLFGSRFLILPILCGSFHKVLDKVSRPAHIPEIESVLRVIRQYVSDHAADTLLVAGVDFSHIGPKFGHSQQAASMLLETKSHDRLLIEAICKGDVEDFWEKSRQVRDKYNVCGFSAVALLLEILQGSRGHLLAYDIWQEESTQSAVSFAAIAFENK